MKQNRWTQEKAALFVELWQSEMPVQEIAEKFGVRPNRACMFASWLRIKGVPLRKRYSGSTELIDFADLKAIVAQEKRQ